MSLQEEFRKLEYEIEFQHFQSTVKKNKDSNDANMNQNAKESLIVSGMAISYNSLHHSLRIHGKLQKNFYSSRN